MEGSHWTKTPLLADGIGFAWCEVAVQSGMNDDNGGVLNGATELGAGEGKKDFLIDGAGLGGSVGETTIVEGDITAEDDTTGASIAVSSSEDESDSDEELEDSPPPLKYSRPLLPKNLFNRDPVSKCLFTDNYFIFATHSGLVHILTPAFVTVKTIKAHKASVLSIHASETHFATGSMDGTIAIGSFSLNEVKSYDFQRPIHCVALLKNYEKSLTFISGGMSSKVILSSITWFGKKSDLVLDQDNGTIVGLHVSNDVAFWFNDNGITFYNLQARKIIKIIPKPQKSPRSDLYWPEVAFPETDLVTIGWGNFIYSLKIFNKVDTSKKLIPSSASFRVQQDKDIEVGQIFELDFLICGLVSFNDLWMILTYPLPDESLGKTDVNPDLKLFNSIKGEVVYEEEIGLNNSKNFGLNDFMLGTHYASINSYYIVSARDFVAAQEFQLEDQLTWYVTHDKYLKAWEMSSNLVNPIQRLNYGIKYIDSLIKFDDWDKALEFLRNLLAINVEEIPDGDERSTVATSQSDDREKLLTEKISQWDTWAHIFIETNHVSELTQILSTSPKLNLSKSIYNHILEYWLQNDLEEFYNLVNEWNTGIYDINSIQDIMESMVEQSPQSENLRRYLTSLYEKSFEPDKAVKHLLKLRDQNLIPYISKNHIFMKYTLQLPEMIKIKFKENSIDRIPIETIKEKIQPEVSVLVDHRQEFLPDQVLTIFHEANLDFINYFYLESLLIMDEFMASGFINQRIKLLCQYDRPTLSILLQKSNTYDIELAIKLCEENGFIEELVYLLGKVGESFKALRLIIEELNDPIKAIDFAKKQNDGELWKQLVDYSMDKPNFINALIEHSDDQSSLYYDPITILKKLPQNIRVQGLTESVIRFSKNNGLNLILNQLILMIVYQQSEQASKEYRSGLLRGFEVDIEKILQNFETLLVKKFGRKYDIQTHDREIRHSFKSMEHKLKILKMLQAESDS